MNITASESNCSSSAPPLVKHYLDLRSPRTHFVTHLDGLYHSYLDVRTPVCMDHFKSTIQQYKLYYIAATYHTFPTDRRRLPLPLVWSKLDVGALLPPKQLNDSHMVYNRVSQKKQKSEFWNATYPSGFHRLDEPPALETHKRHFASHF